MEVVAPVSHIGPTQFDFQAEKQHIGFIGAIPPRRAWQPVTVVPVRLTSLAVDARKPPVADASQLVATDSEMETAALITDNAEQRMKIIMITATTRVSSEGTSAMSVIKAAISRLGTQKHRKMHQTAYLRRGGRSLRPLRL